MTAQIVLLRACDAGTAPMSETPLEFVRRNGPTLTHEVAYRFGMWDQRNAYKAMSALRRQGLVSSRRVAHDFGASLEWTAKS